jgi:hypothetical protein
LADLKTATFAQMLDCSAAVLLIEKIRVAYDRHFRQMMSQYQSATQPQDIAPLRDRLVSEIFGE